MSSQGWYCLFKNRQRCVFGGRSRRRVAYFLESHGQHMEPTGDYELYPAHLIHYQLEESGDSAAHSPTLLDTTSSRESSFNDNFRPGDRSSNTAAPPASPESFPTNVSMPLSLLVSHNGAMDSWDDLDTSVLYEEEEAEQSSMSPPNPESNSRIHIAMLTGHSREHTIKAATVVAAAVEEATSLMEIDDENVPQLQINCRGLTPRQLMNSVNSLLAPLRPYVFKPRDDDHPPPSTPTSDWETASSAHSWTNPSPPLSPSTNSQLHTASLSPIHTPLSPPSHDNNGMITIKTPISIPPSPSESILNVEMKTSTARTSLQAALNTVHHTFTRREEIRDNNRAIPDLDSTMTTV